MLSVIIIAKNEEANIRHCLESVRFADEIIVVDSGSTDSTVAIAREYTDKVLVTDWRGYGIQKQRALNLATGKWVLNLDADETVTAALQKSILEKTQMDKADAYRVPVYFNFYGRLLKRSCCPKRHIRLYKRAGAHYTSKIVHEEVIVPKNARIGQLAAGIEHRSFQDLSHALYKMNRYTSYSAKIRIQNQTKPSMLKAILGGLAMFIRCYVLQAGFLEGRDGFLLAVFNSHSSFYRHAKVIYQDRLAHVVVPEVVDSALGRDSVQDKIR